MVTVDRGMDRELGTAALVHELQGRIASIAMFSEELASNDRRHESSYLEKRLGQIRRAAEELLRILDGVRRLNGCTPPVRVAVDLSAIAKTIAQSHVERAPRFQLATVLVQPDIQVFAAPDEVAVLLENLIGNALKFSAIRSTPVIRVSAEAQTTGTVVHVTDNGIGIAAEDARRMFEPFTRCHSGFDGSGLGLAIAKRIVDRHGGAIWATGAIDHGTTVSFHI